MKKFKLFAVFLSLIFIGACNTGTLEISVQETEHQYIIDNYNKQEFQIPMRDGVKLFTAVYTPKDSKTKYPILYIRTPYSLKPYGNDSFPKTLGSSVLLAHDKYIFVYQDVRGRFMSEGEFVDMRPFASLNGDTTNIDESTDAWDTIEWLINNIDNNNGKVGMWGNSYPGYYAAAATINAHPALKAVTPQCPVSDWFFDDFHHNGAFFPAHFLNFFQYFGQVRDSLVKEWPAALFEFPTQDGYSFYLNEIEPLTKVNTNYYKNKIPFWDSVTAHPDYDYFWQNMSLNPSLKNIKPAVLTVGGWFDAEDLYGPLHVYDAIEKNTVDNDNRIVMGPWKHGGFARGNGAVLGDVFFGDNPPPSEYYQKEIEFPFFKYYLKGEGELKLSEATVFETGTNQWKNFDQWPPNNLSIEQLYLLISGRLSDTISIEQESARAFISDPSKPVPYTNYITQGMKAEYMVEDQRFASKRQDVLVYETAGLKKSITMAGKLKITLYVSTNQSDADWIVKLIDVYPDNFKNYEFTPDYIQLGGYQQMVRSEVFRGRYRNSFEKPEPFIPDKITKVEFYLQDLLHAFQPGHKIMIQVQSTWFPLVDLNPQKYVENIFYAKKEDFVKATHKIYCTIKYPSAISYGKL